jgi:hypothetical protein
MINSLSKAIWQSLRKDWCWHAEKVSREIETKILSGNVHGAFKILHGWYCRHGGIPPIAHKQESFWWYHLIYSVYIFIWSHVPSQDTKEIWQACWPILEHSILFQSEWLINFERNLKSCADALGATDVITNHLCWSCSAQSLCHLVTNWKALR